MIKLDGLPIILFYLSMYNDFMTLLEQYTKELILNVLFLFLMWPSWD